MFCTVLHVIKIINLLYISFFLFLFNGALLAMQENNNFLRFAQVYGHALRPRLIDKRNALIKNTAQILLVDGIKEIYAQSLDGIQRYTLIKSNNDRIVAEKSLTTATITCKLTRSIGSSESLSEHYFDAIKELIEKYSNK